RRRAGAVADLGAAERGARTWLAGADRAGTGDPVPDRDGLGVPADRRAPRSPGDPGRYGPVLRRADGELDRPGDPREHARPGRELGRHPAGADLLRAALASLAPPDPGVYAFAPADLGHVHPAAGAGCRIVARDRCRAALEPAQQR